MISYRKESIVLLMLFNRNNIINWWRDCPMLIIIRINKVLGKVKGLSILKLWIFWEGKYLRFIFRIYWVLGIKRIRLWDQLWWIILLKRYRKKIKKIRWKLRRKPPQNQKLNYLCLRTSPLFSSSMRKNNLNELKWINLT